MKIGIVTSSSPANRSDVAAPFLIDFAAGLTRRGCQVTVLAPARRGAVEEDLGYEKRWFDWLGGSEPLVRTRLLSPADWIRTASLLHAGERALRRLIEEAELDACLALWAVPAGYLCWRACRGRLPYAVWALGSDIHTWAGYPLVGGLIKRVLRDAAHRYADGFRLADEVRSLSGGLDCEYLATTRPLPAPQPIPERPGPGLKLLYIGRLERVKGPDVLVDACALVRARGTDFSLLMQGSGSLAPQLRTAISRTGLDGQVTLVDEERPAGAIAAELQAADCLVIPSRNESIPMVFSEAVQAGTPLIVTDVGDMGELARRHGLAEPVPAGDPARLAEAIATFARDRVAQRAAFEAAQAALLELFDIDRSCQRFLDDLREPGAIGSLPRSPGEREGAG